MFIYLIRRTDRHGFDEWGAFVVAAHTPAEARRLVEVGPINPYGEDTEMVDYETAGAFGLWGEPKEIGLYRDVSQPPHVILGSLMPGERIKEMSGPKADWRTLPAGLELDQVVAEKLGWKNPRFGAITGMLIDDYQGRTQTIPEFSTDLNAAFTLFATELGLEWNLFSDFNGITCELGHWNNEPGQADQLEQWNDKTAALAIVKAWLAWQERTDHPAPEVRNDGQPNDNLGR